MRLNWHHCKNNRHDQMMFFMCLVKHLLRRGSLESYRYFHVLKVAFRKIVSHSIVWKCALLTRPCLLLFPPRVMASFLCEIKVHVWTHGRTSARKGRDGLIVVTWLERKNHPQIEKQKDEDAERGTEGKKKISTQLTMGSTNLWKNVKLFKSIKHNQTFTQRRVSAKHRSPKTLGYDGWERRSSCAGADALQDGKLIIYVWGHGNKI